MKKPLKVGGWVIKYSLNPAFVNGSMEGPFKYWIYCWCLQSSRAAWWVSWRHSAAEPAISLLWEWEEGDSINHKTDFLDFLCLFWGGGGAKKDGG